MTTEWTFATLAYVWEYRNGAIVAGGDRIDLLAEPDRERCLAALNARVRTMAGLLDDGWLVMTSFWMVEDLYKSFFHGFRSTPGVLDYITATAGAVVAELQRRGFVLHYVIDATEGESNLRHTLAYLPDVFKAAGLAVIGPQLVAAHLLFDAENRRPTDVAAIKPYRIQGHAIADEVLTEWHRERRSSAYLNVDFNDDTPGLPLDVALSVDGRPGTLLAFRNQAPTEESEAYFRPPPEVEMPAGVAQTMGDEDPAE